MKPLLSISLALLAKGSLCGQEPPPPFHFEHSIAPLLARSGCAAADCHGGATGRGGFKLSLFATNARADYEAITQDLGGRRLDLLEPAESLVLLKPTRQIRHKGGRVIDRGSPTYAALENWIRDGAPYSRGDAGKLIHLEFSAVDPDGSAGRAGAVATFETSDGERYERDVSGMARYESTDERVATVDSDGRIELQGPGEAWILVRYGDRSARLPVIRPFPTEQADHETGLQGSPWGFWRGHLRELGLPPAPAAEPHRLLRRLYLDLTGRPPRPDEIAAFFQRPTAERVATTARILLEGDAFAAQLARHLEPWFEVPAPSEDLRHTRDRNTRLRAMVRGFAAQDASFLDFAASMLDTPDRREFVQRFGDPRDRAEFVGRAHLGMSIGCARCHNHPSDRWSQAQHLQFSALFADPRPTLDGIGTRMEPGKFFLPGDGKPVAPAFLRIGGTAPPVDVESEFGPQLSAFLRGSGAEAFARNTANRWVGLLTGAYLVEAPDDHRLSNPARHEPLLHALTMEFQKLGYRLRPLVESIVTSPFYALDSSPQQDRTSGPAGDPALRHLARRGARAMTGDEFLRSAAFVLGVPPPSAPAPAPPLAQQLQLLNSGLLRDWLRRPGNQVEALLTFEPDPAARLEDLYLLVLTRPPRDEERAEFLPLLRDSDDPDAAARDLAFALLASREFRSNR